MLGQCWATLCAGPVLGDCCAGLVLGDPPVLGQCWATLVVGCVLGMCWVTFWCWAGAGRPWCRGVWASWSCAGLVLGDPRAAPRLGKIFFRPAGGGRGAGRRVGEGRGKREGPAAGRVLGDPRFCVCWAGAGRPWVLGCISVLGDPYLVAGHVLGYLAVLGHFAVLGDLVHTDFRHSKG